MWNIVKINSEFCALKVTEMEGNYEFFLTNFKSIWKKKLSENEIVNIVREFNPHMEATPKVLVKKAINSLEESGESEQLRCEQDDSGVILKPESTIGGFPFKFNLRLDLMNNDSVFQEITLPLLLILQEMKEREENLFEIIRMKESEIEDYRVGGAKLSNKMWKTKLFERKLYSEESCKSEKLSEVIQTPISVFSSFTSLFDSASKRIVESRIFDEEGISDKPTDLSQNSPDLFDESSEPEPKTMAMMKRMPTLPKEEMKPKKPYHKSKSVHQKKLQI